MNTKVKKVVTNATISAGSIGMLLGEPDWLY